MVIRPFRFLVVLLFALGIFGCSGGDKGPPLYALNGKVLLNGQPVTDGAISLEPNAASGNSGPGSSATISEGAFTLPKDNGHIGGEIVAILSPPSFPSGSTVDPKSQFKPQKINVTLPKADGDFEFAFGKAGAKAK